MIKLLLIDDDESFCFVTKSMLHELGYQRVMIAYSGLDGLRAAHSAKPDLILLDIVMPEMNGLEVLDQLKTNRKTRNIPVIMLTGIDEDETRGSALSDYAQEYLVKPVNLETLNSSIERTLVYQSSSLIT